MLLVAGLIAIAVANEMVIAHPHAEASASLSVLLMGGSLIFLLTEAWYARSVLNLRSNRHWFGCLAMLMVGSVTLFTPAFVSLMLVCSTLVVIAVLAKR